MKEIKYICVILILTLIPNSGFGQSNDNFHLKLGVGIYEGYHISANYFYAKDLNIGFGVGSFSLLNSTENDKHLNIAIENNFHFGTQNSFNSKPWYFNLRAMYWRYENVGYLRKMIVITPSLGRIIGLSEHIGIGIELGPARNYVLDVEIKSPAPDPGMIYDVWLNARAQLIISF